MQIGNFEVRFSGVLVLVGWHVQCVFGVFGPVYGGSVLTYLQTTTSDGTLNHRKLIKYILVLVQCLRFRSHLIFKPSLELTSLE